jgi:hypothetical protein
LATRSPAKGEDEGCAFAGVVFVAVVFVGGDAAGGEEERGAAVVAAAGLADKGGWARAGALPRAGEAA